MIGSQKKWRKTVIYRIFCELPAKTASQSRINPRFFEGYRENEVQRKTGIATLFIILPRFRNFCENEVQRKKGVIVKKFFYSFMRNSKKMLF